MYIKASRVAGRQPKGLRKGVSGSSRITGVPEERGWMPRKLKDSHQGFVGKGRGISLVGSGAVPPLTPRGVGYYFRVTLNKRFCFLQTSSSQAIC